MNSLLDTNVGSLAVSSDVIFVSNMSIDSVRKMNVKFVREIVMKTGWTYRTTSAYKLAEHTVYFALGFEHEKLRKVEFSFTEIAEENVNTQRQEQDRFLETQLGSPSIKEIPWTQYVFSWGTITSYIDPRTDSAGIVLRWA